MGQRFFLNKSIKNYWLLFFVFIRDAKKEMGGIFFSNNRDPKYQNIGPGYHPLHNEILMICGIIVFNSSIVVKKVSVGNCDL
jgi:hypothetical protein